MSGLFEKDDARNTSLVLVKDCFPGCIKFCIGCGPVEHVKFSEVNEFIFPGLLHVNGNARGVVGKDVAPFFGGRIIADPNLCRYTLEMWIEIRAQAHGQNLASPEHHPIQVGRVVLVEPKNLLPREMVAGRRHGGNLT